MTKFTKLQLHKRLIPLIIANIFSAAALGILLYVVTAGITQVNFDSHKVYFIALNTDNIPNAPNGTSYWTFWNICYDAVYDDDVTCTQPEFAHYFSPFDNFNTEDGYPRFLFNNRGTYKTSSEFLFVFFFVGVICALMDFLLGIAGMWSSTALQISQGVRATTLACLAGTGIVMCLLFIPLIPKLNQPSEFPVNARIGTTAFIMVFTALLLETLSFIAAMFDRVKSRNWYGKRSNKEYY